MENTDSQNKFRDLRIQARNQVILLVFSLLLVFLWFTNFSWTLQQKTFSREATETAGEEAKMEVSTVIPITLFIAIGFTIIYIILLIVLTPSFTKNSRNRTNYK